MAAIQQAHLFEDGDTILFGGADLFGSEVPCIAGELELQVQSYEGAGDLPIGDSSAGKSFSITKDSGGSSLSALVVADFADADFMDHVSLDDLAAADHYGHHVCGRQSTADSGAVTAGSGAQTAIGGIGWDATGNPSGCTPKAAPGDLVSSRHVVATSDPQQQQHGQESSDCDMSHTVGDGESSGVGPGNKSVALGSSHSEASEDNTAGVAACRDEEHVSMPSFGLSLTRLTNATPQNQLGSSSLKLSQQPQCQQDPTALGGEVQRAQPAAMTRAYSVDSFALNAAPSATLPEPPAVQAEGNPRTQVLRSYSYVAPGSLPMEFSLGCGDDGLASFGARGRCASLNETQLRRHWLQEGELLAPRLPPSVSELELLELPEDSVPVRPYGCSLLDMQQASAEGTASAGSRPLGSGLTQFKGASASAGSGQGTAVTVKRKIITSPSPLLQQPRSAKSRQAAAAAVSGPSAVEKVQSPKRAKVSAGGYGAWQEGAVAPPTAGALALADWQPPRSAAGMKTSRSMPANMNNFLDDIEVTVQPLGVPGAMETVISPNSAVSASTSQQPFVRPAFMDGTGGVAAVRTAGLPGAILHSAVPPATKTGKGRGAAAGAPVVPQTSIVAGMGMSTYAFPPNGMPVGADGKRFGPVPSVPKPRKRASPNGNPPKAPAPNPNGHCCTQCGTQTTPVWRAGPHGPKTLCNACGVRYMKVAKGNVAPTPRRQQQHHQ